jgi:hypothetical protein
MLQALNSRRARGHSGLAGISNPDHWLMSGCCFETERAEWAEWGFGRAESAALTQRSRRCISLLAPLHPLSQA